MNFSTFTEICINGSIEDLENAITENEKLLNETSIIGDTPLIWTCYGGNIDVIDCLVEKYDRDVSEKNFLGLNGLFRAARGGAV